MMQEFLNTLGSSDMKSLELCLEAYRLNAFREEIEEMGFNTSTGYIWIYLTNGVTIASCFGNDVEYIATNFDTGEEVFYREYYNCLNNISENEEENL